MIIVYKYKLHISIINVSLKSRESKNVTEELAQPAKETTSVLPNPQGNKPLDC